ncbi:MAG: flagellar basal body-associated FliL family protein [Clostridiaceae bacterium]|nr:flagellar basal body-associated FliL family protein [Clostridiaceae bacterium]
MSKGNIVLLSIILFLILFIFFGIGWLIISARQENVQQANAEQGYDLRKTTIHPVAGDAIVTNLNTGDVNDKRIIRVSVQLLVVDDEIVKELKDFNGKVRDIIISVLKSKTPEEAIRPDAQKVIKNEIINAINDAFNTDKVLDLYFEEFIIQ